MQAKHSTALLTNKIIGGNTHRPPIARGLPHNLISGVDIIGTTNTRHRLHFFFGIEKLHANDSGTQSQKAIQVINNLRAIKLLDIRRYKFRHKVLPLVDYYLKGFRRLSRQYIKGAYTFIKIIKMPLYSNITSLQPR